MSKFKVDYSDLDAKLNKKAYKLSDIEGKFKKVAFDIVRFNDGDNGANLWEVQSADDGDYIVSVYQDESDTVKKSDWDVTVMKQAGEIQVSYKGDPLVRVASSKLGISDDELDMVEDYLPSKLAENKKLAQALLKELPESAKIAVLKKYPELV